LSQEEPSQEPSSQESTIEESPNQELENPPRDPKSQSPRRIHKCHEKGMLSFEQPLADQFPTLNNANVTFHLEVREFFVKISMTINESTQVRAYDFGYIWPNEWWNGLPAEKVFIVEVLMIKLKIKNYIFSKWETSKLSVNRNVQQANW
jgi:hypothetical protein